MAHATDRRSFLTWTAASLLGAGSLPRWLAAAGARLPGGARRLIVLELFGGNDALNTLVPIADERYYAARPTLALAREAVLRLDAEQGLHPALKRLAKWYERGFVAIQRGVGSPSPNLSHFSSRDAWATGSVDGVLPDAGWVGRWARAAAGAEPLSVLAIGSDSAPRLVASPQVTAPAVPELGSFRFDANVEGVQLPAREAAARLQAFEAFSRAQRDDPTSREVVAALEETRAASAALSRAVRSQRPVSYPTSHLGSDLAAVADVIACGLPTRVFHVVLGGFDTHTKQLVSHAALLGTLDAALDAFLSDLQSQGVLDQTLVMTTSEFGRRVAENGIGSEAGTDHGAASLSILLGGALRAGLHGAPFDLEHLDSDGNLAFSVDFRSQFSTALGPWLGADPIELLGASYPTLNWVKPA